MAPRAGVDAGSSPARRGRAVDFVGSANGAPYTLAGSKGRMMAISEKDNSGEPDPGFSIESLGREGIRYREGNRSVEIWTEFLIPNGVAVSTKK